MMGPCLALTGLETLWDDCFVGIELSQLNKQYIRVGAITLALSPLVEIKKKRTSLFYDKIFLYVSYAEFYT